MTLPVASLPLALLTVRQPGAYASAMTGLLVLRRSSSHFPQGFLGLPLVWLNLSAVFLENHFVSVYAFETRSKYIASAGSCLQIYHSEC